MSDTHSTSQHILIIVTRAVVGGAQMSVVNVARELHGRGKDVTVAFGDGVFLEKECLKNGIPFIRFDSLRRTFNPLLMLHFIWQMKRLIEREHYDVLHINSSNALFSAIGARLSKRRPRTIFTFRGLSFLDEHVEMSSLKRLFYRLLYRFLCQFIDVPVFVSEENLESARMQGVVEDGVVIYNGLDPTKLSFLTREEARDEILRSLPSEIAHRDDLFLIGSIGRLAYQKNYEFLAREVTALKDDHSNLHVVIIGDGPERRMLELLIAECGVSDRVHLIGEIENASRLIRGFDLFVLPSRYEGLSITLIEVLFAGVPALVSDVGGNREQFIHAPFQVYPLNDSMAFREKLTRLIDNPTICTELSEANKGRSSDFTIERVADEYTELYSRRRGNNVA